MKSINCLENLPNEFFYAMFEYLDGCEIYRAFNKLNDRFQSLVSCPRFLLQIQVDFAHRSQLIDYCHEVILPNKDRLLSLHLHNNFLGKYLFIDCLIDVCFDRLESIFLRGITIAQSTLILSYLQYFPRLYSLTMKIEDHTDDFLVNVYQKCFQLSALKYLKVHCSSLSFYSLLDIDTDLSTNNQLSPLDHLVVNHPCSIDKLLFLLCHTPQLRYFICQSLSQPFGFDINDYSLLPLSNLRYLSIGTFKMLIDTFEQLIKKISAPIQVLIIKDISDEQLLNAQRWKQLIVDSLPQLNQLILTYHGNFNGDDDQDTFIHRFHNEFRSAFSTPWQSLFDIQTIADDIFSTFYLFQKGKTNLCNLLKKRLKILSRQLDPTLDIPQEHFNSNVELNLTHPSTKQSLTNTQWIISPDVPLNTFRQSLSSISINHLNINCEKVSMEMFTEILHLLPDLHSLKVSNMPHVRSNWLFDENDQTIRYQISNQSKIVNVDVDEVFQLNQIHILLYLCPELQHFQIDLSEDLSPRKVFEFVLRRSVRYTPQILCLRLITRHADDQFQRIIQSESSIPNCSIERLSNGILFKWNRQ